MRGSRDSFSANYAALIIFHPAHIATYLSFKGGGWTETLKVSDVALACDKATSSIFSAGSANVPSNPQNYDLVGILLSSRAYHKARVICFLEVFKGVQGLSSFNNPSGE